MIVRFLFVAYEKDQLHLLRWHSDHYKCNRHHRESFRRVPTFLAIEHTKLAHIADRVSNVETETETFRDFLGLVSVSSLEILIFETETSRKN